MKWTHFVNCALAGSLKRAVVVLASSCFTFISFLCSVALNDKEEMPQKVFLETATHSLWNYRSHHTECGTLTQSHQRHERFFSSGKPWMSKKLVLLFYLPNRDRGITFIQARHLLNRDSPLNSSPLRRIHISFPANQFISLNSRQPRRRWSIFPFGLGSYQFNSLLLFSQHPSLKSREREG